MITWLQRSGRILGVLTIVIVIAALVFELPSSRWASVSAASTVGGPIPNLSTFETTLFNTGVNQFSKVWDPVANPNVGNLWGPPPTPDFLR